MIDIKGLQTTKGSRFIAECHEILLLYAALGFLKEIIHGKKYSWYPWDRRNSILVCFYLMHKQKEPGRPKENLEENY